MVNLYLSHDYPYQEKNSDFSFAEFIEYDFTYSLIYSNVEDNKCLFDLLIEKAYSIDTIISRSHLTKIRVENIIDELENDEHESIEKKKTLLYRVIDDIRR